MDISVKELKAGEVEMTVTLPSESVRDEVENRFREYQKKVALKGFRRGKVPMSYIRKNMEGQALNEAVNELINRHYPLAVGEKELVPIDQGNIEKVDHEPGGPLTFVARIEVEPTVELSQYTGLEVERLVREVDDNDMDKALKDLQEKYASWVPVEDGAAQGDQLTCDIQENDSMGLALDERLYKNIDVVLGKGAYGPVFDERMEGVKAGETRDLTITNPEDDPDPEVAGKTEYYTVTVNEVKRAELAEINDDFASEIPPGFDSLEALKEHMRGELSKSLDRNIEQTLNGRIIDQLIEKNPFEVPAKMIDQRLQEIVDQARQGTDNPIDEGVVRETYAQQVENQIRWTLIAKAILKKEEIKIGDSEIEAEIARIAEEQGQPVETIKLQLSRGDSMRRMAEGLVERNLFDFLRSNSTITDKPVEKTDAEESSSES